MYQWRRVHKPLFPSTYSAYYMYTYLQNGTAGHIGFVQDIRNLYFDYTIEIYAAVLLKGGLKNPGDGHGIVLSPANCIILTGWRQVNSTRTSREDLVYYIWEQFEVLL